MLFWNNVYYLHSYLYMHFRNDPLQQHKIFRCSIKRPPPQNICRVIWIITKQISSQYKNMLCKECHYHYCIALNASLNHITMKLFKFLVFYVKQRWIEIAVMFIYVSHFFLKLHLLATTRHPAVFTQNDLGAWWWWRGGGKDICRTASISNNTLPLILLLHYYILPVCVCLSYKRWW